MLGGPVPLAPEQARIRLQLDRCSEGLGRSNAAGALHDLKFGSKLTSGVLQGSNCGMLDLARAAGILCLAVQCSRRLRKLKFGSNSTGGVLLGRIVACLTWRELLGSGVGQSIAAGAHASSNSGRP